MSQEWKGWALSDSALYFSQPPGSSYVGIFMQIGEQTRQMGAFSNVEDAAMVQDWLEEALSSVGQANYELTQRAQEMFAALEAYERG